MKDKKQSGEQPLDQESGTRHRMVELEVWEELQRLKEFNEGIVQSVAEGIVVEDAAGYLTFVNPAAATMLGYAVEALVGRHWTTIVPPDQQPIVQAADQRRRRGETDRYELELLRQDGARLPVLVSGSPRLDADTGDFAGTLVVFTDISERKRAEEALRRRTRQLDALRQMGLELAAQLDLDTLLHSIVSRAVELLGGAIGVLYLYQPDQDALKVEVTVGVDQALVDVTLRPGEELAGRVWESGEPLVVEDYRRWERRVAIHDDQPFHAAVGVPIRWGPADAGEKCLGVLEVVANVPGLFASSDAELLALFATHAALAIENARLYEAERRQASEFAAVSAIAQALNATTDLDSVFQVVARELRRVIDFDRLSLALISEEGRHFTIFALTDQEGAPLAAGVTMPVEASAAARDILAGRPHLTADLSTELDFPGERALYTAGQRSRLNLPLALGRNIIGALNLASRTPNAFSPDQLPMLTQVADAVAAAVQSARLYDETRRRNRDLALLNRVIAASAVSQDIETILETVCRELGRAFGLSHAAAALLNEEKTQARIVAEYQTRDRPSILGQTFSLEGISMVFPRLERATPVTVDSASAAPSLEPIQALMRSHDIASLALLPLIFEGEILGSLALGAASPRSFSAEEVDLAQRVADQVSGALARARLEETQRRLTAAIEQTAEAVVITAPDGDILYVNPAFERLTGYGYAEAVGQSPARLFGRGRCDAAFPQEMLQATEAGQVWRGRLVQQTKDGRSFTVDSMITPVRGEAGEIVNYVVTMHDVTREIQLEEQMRQSQKLEALGRLAGGVAHDFNNLLTVIQLSTRLQLMHMHPQDPLWEHVQRIQETSERAARLTKRLLSFSRREVVKPRVLNLNQVVGHLSRMLQRIIGEDIELATRLADDLWPVKIDPAQMDQVIMNLAVNARDAMPRGGRLTIETANVTLDQAYADAHVDAQPGEYVLLSISDTGQGMSDEVKAHLFEPFFTTKERGQGTGLGLPTVFGIVKQSDGHIWVDSQEGQGTTFQIFLPRATGPVPEAPYAPAPESRAASFEPRTETVLVVEDEASVRELAVRVLESQGYRVLAAGDGLEAIRISEQYQGPIHLLLADVVMPRMGGKELAERLWSRRPEMPVLYMSGHADRTILEHGVAAPGIAFLPKPFTLETLTETVEEILSRAKMEAGL